MKLTDIEKKALCDAKFYSHDAANGARKMLDSKYVESTLTAKEVAALEKMATYLTALEAKYQKLYDEVRPWKN